MDQFTRRILAVDGVALCRMFQRAIRRHGLPRYLSSDHDPLYRFQQWQANLRVLEVKEIKTVPHVPLSHPFVERMIGTVRREYLDRTLFWTAADLEEAIRFSKLLQWAPDSCGAGRTPARTERCRSCFTIRPRLVPLAETLSRVILHSNRRVIFEFAMDRLLIGSCDRFALCGHHFFLLRWQALGGPSWPRVMEGLVMPRGMTTIRRARLMEVTGTQSSVLSQRFA